MLPGQNAWVLSQLSTCYLYRKIVIDSILNTAHCIAEVRGRQPVVQMIAQPLLIFCMVLFLLLFGPSRKCLSGAGRRRRRRRNSTSMQYFQYYYYKQVKNLRQRMEQRRRRFSVFHESHTGFQSLQTSLGCALALPQSILIKKYKYKEPRIRSTSTYNS